MIQINGLTAVEQKLEEQKKDARQTPAEVHKDPATALTLLIGLFTVPAVTVRRERMLI